MSIAAMTGAATHRMGSKDAAEPYRVLFEESPLPTWVLDSSSLRVLTVNQSAIEQYGYSREEFLTMSLKDFAPGDSESVWHHRKKDGAVISVEAWAREVTFDGVAARLVMANEIQRDTEPELQQVVAELTQLNAVLEQRVKAQTQKALAAEAELDVFSYSVSHDLRAPLRHIDAFSRMLERHVTSELNEEAQHYFQRIREGVLRMTRLIDGVIHLTRVSRQEVKSRPTPLAPLVQRIIQDLTRQNPDRRIEWKIGNLPQVDCDPELIGQVFSNLLSNAVKFTRSRKQAEIEIGAVIEEGQTIFVKDNGIGFDMKFADKLFGVFQKLHRQTESQGTGVGLAIAQRVIRKHHGKIWATAEPNKGCTFYFSLG